MIQTRQKNIRIFEIDNTQKQECKEFLIKNAILLRDYLIFFVLDPQEDLKELCQELGLTYFVPNHSFVSHQDKKQKPQEEFLRVVSKPVRSGEEIDHEGDLVICSNVHHGARIYASGNLTIFGACDGRVECGGEYLILRTITSNQVIFSGQIFSVPMLEKINNNPQKFKLIVRNGDFITIKEID